MSPVAKHSDETYVELLRKDMAKTIHPVNKNATNVVDYRIYRLHDCNQAYSAHDARRLSKTTERIRVQIRQSMFDPDEPITVLSCLSTFRAAGLRNKISERAAV